MTVSLQIPLAGVELGNEPNLYVFNFGDQNYVPASLLASDYGNLNTVMDIFFSRKFQPPKPLRIGPDIALQVPVLGEVIPGYLKGFLQNVGTNLDVITYHYYPLQSTHCPFAKYDPYIATVEKALGSSVVESFEKWTDFVIKERNEHVRICYMHLTVSCPMQRFGWVKVPLQVVVVQNKLMTHLPVAFTT